MGLYPAPRLLPAGDGAVSVELGDEISRDANTRALTLERLLLDAGLPGLVDTVPTFRALLVQYDPLVLPWAALRARLLELAGRLADAPPPPGRWVELPRHAPVQPATAWSEPRPGAAGTAPAEPFGGTGVAPPLR